MKVTVCVNKRTILECQPGQVLVIFHAEFKREDFTTCSPPPGTPFHVTTTHSTAISTNDNDYLQKYTTTYSAQTRVTNLLDGLEDISPTSTPVGGQITEYNISTNVYLPTTEADYAESEYSQTLPKRTITQSEMSTDTPSIMYSAVSSSIDSAQSDYSQTPTKRTVTQSEISTETPRSIYSTTSNIRDTTLQTNLGTGSRSAQLVDLSGGDTLRICISQNVYGDISRLCHGNRTCELLINKHTMKTLLCWDANPYVEIEYICVDGEYHLILHIYQTM